MGRENILLYIMCAFTIVNTTVYCKVIDKKNKIIDNHLEIINILINKNKNTYDKTHLDTVSVLLGENTVHHKHIETLEKMLI